MDFNWTYTFGLLINLEFWQATLTVVELSVLVWGLGIVLGLFLALAKQSTHAVLSKSSSLYIWFFRSLPLLVLLVFVFNMPQIFPSTSGLLSSPFVAGLIAMVLCEAAFIAEIHRSGLIAVQKGQIEAGKALGLKYLGIQRLIVLPQALQVSIPSLGNEFVTIVKLTSLVSVISLTEILMVGQRLYSQNFLVMETMLGVAFYYVLIVTIFGWMIAWLEKRIDFKQKHPALWVDTEHLNSTQHLNPNPYSSTDSSANPNSHSSTDANANPNLHSSTHSSINPSPYSALNPAATPVSVSSIASAQAKQNSEYALEAHNVHKAYAQHEVLKGIDLKVRWGEVISIIGPSGSGKTTLIRTLNGLESMNQGEVKLMGESFLNADVAAESSRAYREKIVHVGMVFQSFNLFPHKTILENIILAPNYHYPRQTAAHKATALLMLEKVGMKVHANKYPHQLSGGQQQRVAIARALAMQPAVILFDEPTSALDPELVNEVLKVMETLANEGLTMIIVTHEMNFAFKISDRVIFMENGRVIENDRPENLLASENPRLKAFLKQS